MRNAPPCIDAGKGKFLRGEKDTAHGGIDSIAGEKRICMGFRTPFEEKRDIARRLLESHQAAAEWQPLGAQALLRSPPQNGMQSAAMNANLRKGGAGEESPRLHIDLLSKAGIEGA